MKEMKVTKESDKGMGTAHSCSSGETPLKFSVHWMVRYNGKMFNTNQDSAIMREPTTAC